ncbi:CPBP family intramembrane glutamic endopeptidase [Streptococcus dentiloxodontae]
MKSHLKRIAILIYQGVFLLIATFFSRLVLELMLIYNYQHKQSFSTFQSLLLIFFIMLTLFVTYHWARSQQLLPESFKFQKGQGSMIAWGLLSIFIVNILGNIILSLNGVSSTDNQASINELFSMVPFVPLAISAISAGFFEELFCRRWIFSLFGKYRLAALFGSSAFFCWLHSPSDLGSFVIYFGMGFVLGFLYYKTDNIYTSMLLHMLWNSIGVLAILFSLL